MARKHQAKEADSIPAPVVGASPAQAILRREQTKSADFFSIYANDVMVTTSPWDLRMILGEIGDLSDVAVLSVKQLGEVRISPQLAKKLVLIMIDQLKTYEERFGEIPGVKD